MPGLELAVRHRPVVHLVVVKLHLLASVLKVLHVQFYEIVKIRSLPKIPVYDKLRTWKPSSKAEKLWYCSTSFLSSSRYLKILEYNPICL